MNVNRPLLEVQFTTYDLLVGTTPTPVKVNGALTDYIESFIVSVPNTAANSVFFGNNNVTITTGMEIVRGIPIQMTVQQVRQLYELQAPLEEIVKNAPVCKPGFLSESIPFVCWNLGNVFLVAAAATNVSITTFRIPFV